jgi:Ca2+-binding RTX toxin-like protein
MTEATTLTRLVSRLAAPLSVSLACVVLTAPPRTHAVAPSCFGTTPTIVGTGWQLMGTEGPDVVITNGAGEVDTLGGDDLVCITGISDQGEFYTGTGNDRVDSSGISQKYGMYVAIHLGEGADELIGGPHNEGVFGNEWYGDDNDRDVISTAGGRDSVVSGGSAPNEDRINLGTEGDRLHLIGAAPQAVIRGGRGRDQLVIQLPGSDGSSLRIDNRKQRVTLGGILVGRWSSFSAFYHRSRGPFTFIGTGGPEKLGIAGREWPVDVRMGGDRDLVLAKGGAPDSRFDGGSGTDTFHHQFLYEHPAPRNSAILFDLASGKFRVTLRGESMTQQAIRFENADMRGSAPTIIRGTAGPNRLWHVQWGVDTTIYGRAGNDRLRSSDGNDTLIGGPGRDRAAGSRGTDRCDAEIRINCEL